LKNKNYNIIFAISLLLIISATMLSIYLLRQAQQDRFWAEHRRRMEVELNSILRNTFEMEASIRGYAVSHNKEMISEFNSARAELNKNLNIADSLIMETPIQRASLDTLKRMVTKRMDVFYLTREAAFDSVGDRERIISLIVLGDNMMSDIKKRVEIMSGIELKLLKERTVNVDSFDSSSLISVLVAGCITLMVISFGFVKLRREIYYKELAFGERLEAMAVLEESELRYRNLNESANDAIIIADESENIVSWNPAAANIFGYTESEAVGMHLSIILPEKHKDIHKKRMDGLKANSAGKIMGKRLELSGRNKSGKEFPIEITLGQWSVNNKHFFSSVIRDISERKKSEKNHARLIENLKRSNQDLEQFAYVASHDLQEPLRKIQSFGDRFLIKHISETTSEGKEYITRMMDAASRMQILIEDLLAFSIVSRNTENKESVNLKSVLERVKDDLQVKITETNTEIKSDILPEIKKGSFIQLTQLFSNIISNAIKFQRQGNNPVINIECRSIVGREIKKKSMNLISSRSYFEIKFRDNGIGFDDKYADKIFTIFQRLHGRSEFAGTGIGLAVCRKICDNHDGFISADGLPDSGATFAIYLPQ
jgi:two-component system sensor kinase FixL